MSRKVNVRWSLCIDRPWIKLVCIVSLLRVLCFLVLLLPMSLFAFMCCYVRLDRSSWSKVVWFCWKETGSGSLPWGTRIWHPQTLVVTTMIFHGCRNIRVRRYLTWCFVIGEWFSCIRRVVHWVCLVLALSVHLARPSCVISSPRGLGVGKGFGEIIFFYPIPNTLSRAWCSDFRVF